MLSSTRHVLAGQPIRDGSGKGRLIRTDWSAYATAYDLLSLHNPAYRELMEDFRSFLEGIPAPAAIEDIGGGTGNYSMIASSVCPDSRVRMIEPDVGMLAVAERKLADRTNVVYEPCPIEKLETAGGADLIVCVHALYTMADPEIRLRAMAEMLNPGGWLYLVDLGRELDLADWRRYLLGHLIATYGLVETARIAWQGRQIARQNRRIRADQRAGIYWTYAKGELAKKVAATGLEVIEHRPVYRGYSDFVIARAPLRTQE